MANSVLGEAETPTATPGASRDWRRLGSGGSSATRLAIKALVLKLALLLEPGVRRVIAAVIRQHPLPIFKSRSNLKQV
ncbi:MAG: hypothetical protein ACK59A_06745 [Cyanobacteriota bacterium]|jgi:hypothetical protein